MAEEQELQLPLEGLEPVNRYRSAEALLARAREAIVAAEKKLREAQALAQARYKGLVDQFGVPELDLAGLKAELKAAAKPPFSKDQPLIDAGKAWFAAEARLAAALEAFDQGAVDAAVKEVGESVPSLLPS